jgi:hypothetical protein
LIFSHSAADWANADDAKLRMMPTTTYSLVASDGITVPLLRTV